MRTIFLAICAAASLSLSAQVFDDPVRLQAGNNPAGHNRLYPSPALYDITGDGKLELVVGDLRGNLTFAVRTDDGWGPERPLLGANGQQLRFNNW